MKQTARSSFVKIQLPKVAARLPVEPVAAPGEAPAFVAAWNGTAVLDAADETDDAADETDDAWAGAWADAGPLERRHRVGDLVLAGHSVFEARRLAPTTLARPEEEAGEWLPTGYAELPRARRLEMRGVRPGDLDLEREYDPTRVTRRADGTVAWIDQGATDRENSRRVGDLVLAGHSIADARRLAPTTPTPPDEREELIGTPMAPEELAAARLAEFREHAALDGVAKATARLAGWAEDRARSVDRAVAADRARTPTSARAWAESHQLLVDSLHYRHQDRARRLRAVGLHRERDQDVFCPSVVRPPRRGGL
jgi:hypothetical protein